MKVEYEALLTKHELIVNEQEKQLKKTHSALQETEHICDERVKIIDQLETTNAELVRIAILSSIKLFFTIIIFSMQEYHKNRLQSKLEGADGDIKALNSDVDTLKAGLNAIVEILQDSADEPPTPVHEYDAESVVGEKETVPKGVTMPSSKALPSWITSPVNQIPIQVLHSIVSK